MMMRRNGRVSRLCRERRRGGNVQGEEEGQKSEEMRREE